MLTIIGCSLTSGRPHDRRRKAKRIIETIAVQLVALPRKTDSIESMSHPHIPLAEVVADAEAKYMSCRLSDLVEVAQCTFTAR